MQHHLTYYFIRNIQSRETPFPLGMVSQAVFDRAEAFIDAAGAKHLLCVLAADETKLTPALRPYWDQSTGDFYVIGAAGEPIKVTDVDQLETFLDQGNYELASKVGCIWVEL